MNITRKNLLKTSILLPFVISCNNYARTEGVYVTKNVPKINEYDQIY